MHLFLTNVTIVVKVNLTSKRTSVLKWCPSVPVLVFKWNPMETFILKAVSPSPTPYGAKPHPLSNGHMPEH